MSRLPSRFSCLSLLRCCVLAAFGVAAGGAHASGLIVQAIDATGAALADVVIYAEPEAGQKAPMPQRSAEIEQRGLKFMPMVTVIQTGSKISFPNNDKVRHHIYSFSPAHKFDQKLYSGTTATPQVFDKAGLVVLGCNIHDKMVAYVRIVDTPYFSKTDASGATRLDLPAGKYTVKAWHYHGVGGQPSEQAIVVKAGDTLGATTFKISMKPPGSDADAN